MRLARALFLSLIFAGCGDKDATDGDDTASPDIDGDGFPASVDCNDEVPTIFPGAPEGCDDVDSDCDGAVDEGGWRVVFDDLDGDGFGAGGPHGGDCAETPGEVSVGDDCDDSDAAVHPGADELCDGLDNDCDGRTDIDALDGTVAYTDADRDGYGDESTRRTVCTAGWGLSAEGGDCDDADRTAHPGAEEVCDTVDNDCDGAVDEEDATDRTAWFPDDDDDGWAGEGTPVYDCVAPSGYVAAREDVDCDDDDPSVHPGVEEVCLDGLDNDCDQSAAACRVLGSTAVGSLRAVLYIGEGADDQLGAGFGPGAADLDGDGVLDLAAGAPRANSRRGAVYVVPGASLSSGDVRAADDALVLTGSSAGDYFGTSLALAGDWTGDGQADLWVGAPGADDGGNGSGAVLLFAGPVGSGSAADALLTLSGVQGDELGEALSPAGDTDGDGFEDLAAVAPAWSNDKGRIYLVFGPATSGAASIDADAVILYGETRGDGQGLRVSGGGDADADGLPDLLVGTPMGSYGGVRSGVAWVHASPLGADAPLSDGVALYGYVAGDEAGAAVSWIGDTDGDGYDDALVGAPTAGLGGEAYLVLGPLLRDTALQSSATTVQAVRVGDEVGAAVAGAGDLDGDSRAEWVVGAPGYDSDRGLVAIEYGGTPSLGGPITGFSLVLSGGATGDALGASVGGVGDLTGDGYGDLALGAPHRDQAADTDAGGLYLVTGQGW